MCNFVHTGKKTNKDNFKELFKKFRSYSKEN